MNWTDTLDTTKETLDGDTHELLDGDTNEYTRRRHTYTATLYTAKKLTFLYWIQSRNQVLR